MANGLLTGLVAYYALDGDLLDASGNGRALTPVAASYGAGLLGQALAGGRGVRAVFGALGVVATTPFSVSGWLRAVDPGDNSAAGYIGFPAALLSYRGGGGSGDDPGYIDIAESVADASDPAPPLTGAVGDWHHVALTSSGAGVIRLYINATLVATGTTWATPAADLSAGSFAAADDQDADAPKDEVGVWSRALSAADVAALYNGGAGLAYSAFDSGSNDTGAAATPALQLPILMGH